MLFNKKNPTYTNNIKKYQVAGNLQMLDINCKIDTICIVFLVCIAFLDDY